MEYAICYDCGWGECGFHELYLSFQGVLDYLDSRNMVSAKETFIEFPNEYLEFDGGCDLYIMPMHMYDETRWEGSQDY